MNRSFVYEDLEVDEEAEGGRGQESFRNYLTPAGYQALREELEFLVRVERPQVVEVVAWAASNGDRSENGDYLYGKKRLRAIDRRIRYLTKRLESAVVVDPKAHGEEEERVFFGATVTVYDPVEEREEQWQIVGVDEADAKKGRISWLSPLAQALLRRTVGDEVKVRLPEGVRVLEIVAVRYE
ncbi:MAG: transcription elongation factor GreB [Hydrogenophilus sp.]|nr:transcription elongation factor GreB [Hydrogenophilus sp.]